MHLLFGKPTKPHRKIQPQVLHLEQLPVPVHIFMEPRRNSRVSLLKDKIHLRLPRSMPQATRGKEIKNLLAWAEAHIAKKQMYKTPATAKDYSTPQTIELIGTSWSIEFIAQEDLGTFRGSVHAKDRKFRIKADPGLINTPQGQKAWRSVLVQLIRNSHSEQIYNLVSEINDKTLQMDFKRVTLKDMNSRWGSCSIRKNINLSVRLLLLPEAVIRYVILHELAHLREMNHSPRYWKIVAQHMPEYKTYENWLKKHGHAYDL